MPYTVTDYRRTKIRLSFPTVGRYILLLLPVTTVYHYIIIIIIVGMCAKNKNLEDDDRWDPKLLQSRWRSMVSNLKDFGSVQLRVPNRANAAFAGKNVFIF